MQPRHCIPFAAVPKKDVEAMLKNPQAREYMRTIAEIAEIVSHTYEVVNNFEAS